MNRIRLLPEQVANQIAAGEVIERPASVVKELVENALDAAATRLTIEVQAGGRSLIRVTDDGLGMSRDDALLCFERHATSKIKRAEDLQAIASMGFRGEALPSIASVSRLTLTTRERDTDNPEATRVLINGGRIAGVQSASGAAGTCIEVRQLFFNLPARRKFLRREQTERAHIHHYLTLAALAFTEVGFTFVHDQRTVWQLPPLAAGAELASKLRALRERLRALYGADLNLVTVDYRGPLCPSTEAEPDATPVHATGEALTPPNIRIWGFMGAPGVSRATREDQHLFVNRRPIEHRGLNFALLEGYHTALMKGRYPVACLFLELDPAEVDVNVHPAKREVRFRADYAVRAALTQAVRQALLAWHAQTTPAPTLARKAEPTQAKPPTPEASPLLPHRPMARPQRTEPPAALPPPPSKEADSARSYEASASATSAATVVVCQAEAAVAGRERETVPAPVPLLAVPLRVIGVLGRLYVVLESDRGLVLLDQHAAHERVLFEQMLQRLEQGQAPCQRLLLPATVELSPRDAQFLRDQLATLNRLGVSLSEFGERTFLLDGLPPFVQASDARQFVLEVVDELKATGQAVNALRLGEHVVAKTVCRHAVKANDPLEGAELDRLLEDLRHCAMPYTCPHGRPTLIELNYRELERKFGRVQ